MWLIYSLLIYYNFIVVFPWFPQLKENKPTFSVNFTCIFNVNVCKMLVHWDKSSFQARIYFWKYVCILIWPHKCLLVYCLVDRQHIILVKNSFCAIISSSNSILLFFFFCMEYMHSDAKLCGKTSINTLVKTHVLIPFEYSWITYVGFLHNIHVDLWRSMLVSSSSYKELSCKYFQLSPVLLFSFFCSPVLWLQSEAMAGSDSSF